VTRRLTPEEERQWKALTGQAAGVDHGRVRKVTAEEQRLWHSVTSPAPVLRMPPQPAPKPAQLEAAAPQPQPRGSRRPPPPGGPQDIEPNRQRRLVREREPIEARIDLHGLDQDRARAALERFLSWSHAQGYRAVLVITGKGLRGDGVLRQRMPEWLADPALRPMIAGLSRADRRHGGEGAFYVALRRRSALR
jgi:DNA-nicking Smr family endonuclease